MYVPYVGRKKLSYSYGWTRPTIQWSLACETDSGFTRADAYDLYTSKAKVDLSSLN